MLKGHLFRLWFFLSCCTVHIVSGNTLLVQFRTIIYVPWAVSRFFYCLNKTARDIWRFRSWLIWHCTLLFWPIRVCFFVRYKHYLNFICICFLISCLFFNNLNHGTIRSHHATIRSCHSTVRLGTCRTLSGQQETIIYHHFTIHFANINNFVIYNFLRSSLGGIFVGNITWSF